MKPFVKWVGGKNKIIDKILAHFPKQIDTYYEPFLGGGSVLIALLESDIIVQKIIVNDINSALIDVYKYIKTNPNQLMESLDKLIRIYDSVPTLKFPKRTTFKKQTLEEAKQNGKVGIYYYFRDLFNTTNDKLLKSALFIFLNKTCFRGLFREGINGFNTPFGNYKNPLFYNRKNIIELHKAFQNIEFHSTDFQQFLPTTINDNDFVYLDPPYKDTFQDYNKNKFNKDAEEAMFQICQKLKKFAQSNSNCTFNQEKYQQYQIYIINTNHSINSKNPGKKTSELIIVGQ
jgi:DNA adenine methylase